VLHVDLTVCRHHREKRDEEVVCYGELGCFRDEGPFDYLDMLPSPPEEVSTKLLLYTRQSREAAAVLSYDNMTALEESTFNVSLPLRIIVHGFGSGCNRVWPREMRVSFLAVGSAFFPSPLLDPLTSGTECRQARTRPSHPRSGPTAATAARWLAAFICRRGGKVALRWKKNDLLERSRLCCAAGNKTRSFSSTPCWSSCNPVVDRRRRQWPLPRSKQAAFSNFFLCQGPIPSWT